VEFICAAEPNVPDRLRGDPARLRQILVNLAGNAVKFTEHGEIDLRAEVVHCEGEEIEIRFAVRDTGIGIEPEKSSRLFQKFSQIDTSSTRRYGGTGLGLAIAKELAHLMDGEIGVESEPGKGSVFWFTAQFTLGQAVEEPENAEDPRRNLAGLDVLVVDDNRTNREILENQRTAWGARVVTAVDGPDALRILRSHLVAGKKFQLAVLDMQMPGMDGLALARIIHEDPQTCDLPMVLLTSLLHSGPSEDFRLVGISHWLTKPAKESELREALCRAVRLEPQGEVPDESAAPQKFSQAPVESPQEPLGDSLPRVLLVEDNATNRLVARNFLQKLGMHVVDAGNGQEAVDILAEEDFDVVFMDVQMPVMDGIQATKIIRDSASGVRNHEIPVIAMTAHAMKGDEQICLESGMNDYLSKPVQLDGLRKKLDRWLPGSNAGST
jgi:CheY-like chemotaxis protein